MKLLIAASSLIALSAGAASAATYTFHFSDDYIVSGGEHEKTFRSVEDESFTVDVSGHYYSLGVGGTYVPGSASDVDLNSYGLISENGSQDYHAIDSWGSDESFKFSFDKEVSLSYVYVSWSYSNYGAAEWDVFKDGVLETTESGQGWKSFDLGEDDDFAIGTRTLTKYYYCDYAGGICSYQDQSAIKIKKIIVEHDPAVVPLPAAGWMLLAGLGGLGALRRRKS